MDLGGSEIAAIVKSAILTYFPLSTGIFRKEEQGRLFLFLFTKIPKLMKQTLLCFVALAAAGSLAAQVTITTADVAPVYTQIRQARDTTPTVTSVGSGANQTWNYSALNNQGVDTLTFTLPQFTPYAANFGGSNLAVDQRSQGNDVYIYLNNSASELNIQGQAFDPFGTGVMPIAFNNPEIMIPFPAAYGSSWSDTATAMFQMYYGQDPGIGFTVDSFRIHMWVKKTADADAWGAVTTPAGTYNVLRENVLRVEYDTIDIYAFGNWAPNFYSQQDSNRVFTYWANGIGFPVVELTEGQDLGSVTSATWLLGTAAVGIPENTVGMEVPLYPNPASGFVNFDTKGSAIRTISIYDVNGQLIETANVSSDNTRIDVSAYASGLYFYNATDANGNVTARGKFNVAH